MSEAYERFPNMDVNEILKVSYDGLEENEKEFFIDIACVFRGCAMKYVINVLCLCACGFGPKYGTRTFEKRSTCWHLEI